jgi:hypothetical protein
MEGLYKFKICLAKRLDSLAQFPKSPIAGKKNHIQSAFFSHGFPSI